MGASHRLLNPVFVSLIMILLVAFAMGTMLINLLIQVSAVMSSTGFWVSLHRKNRIGSNKFHDAAMLTVVFVKLLIAHLLQIAVWAGTFMLCGEFADFETAFYHSTVNFASLGYGDIVMSSEWRLLGALEAMVGVMMFGVSAAMLFAALSELLRIRFKDTIKQLKKEYA